MFFLKKLVFKFMELGLGLNTYFSLETKNPVFVNFKLSDPEAIAVQRSLPSGVVLKKINFCQSDPFPEYWISFNLYEIKYPKKELENIRKVRCEINTFVQDAFGRHGIYVFSGSPYVSRRKKNSLIERICDFAEKVVMFIYGCGKLIFLNYRLSENELLIEFQDGDNAIKLRQKLEESKAEFQEKLSDDYFIFNDISFFNRAKTFDRVSINSAFVLAKFERISCDSKVKTAFFNRQPDAVLFCRENFTYSVNAMNRSVKT